MSTTSFVSNQLINTAIDNISNTACIIEDAKRCNMLCPAGKRCNRTKCKSSDYCGTHQKQINHNKDVIELFGINYKGIIYYVDSLKNVYDTEAILLNKNMIIIGKYENDVIILN